ncbi:MAG: CoA-transferase [Betaproteobacteria bacterium RIFCSPLOWO2_12_FULL_64_23]|nr:MAG: CoA-transferase [Betaproteobacteria bacterium RIFCSPLOWO2_12_FULL_64_23]
MKRPLDGIVVVALEHAIAAPLATRHLADNGARVIKIERPGSGDFARAYDQRVRGLASHFVWTNRGKESVTLDLKHAQALPVLHRLLSRADVLVQNLAPGAAARLGLDAAAIHRINPRAIVCGVSGYGEGGPYRDKKAYDLLIQAEAGFLSITGSEGDMAKSGISIADIAGGMYAYSGILNALLLRERTGHGSSIEVSLLDCLAEWMGYPLYYASDGAAQPARTGAMHATIYPYGPFQAGDGKTVMIAIQNEREWALFCDKVLGAPQLALDPRFDSNAKRSGNRLELAPIVRERLAQLPAADLIALLDAASIANASVNTVEGLREHPQLRARERWTEVASPAGPLPALRPPPLSDAYAQAMGNIPALGEHTDGVLAWLGYGASEIAALRAGGLI